MKKYLFITLFAILAIMIKPAKAQFDYFGGGIALATGGDYTFNGVQYFNKSFGIDLRAHYDFSKKLKLVPDFKFYLPNKEEFVLSGESKTITVFAVNLNAHYILNSKTRDNYRMYLIAGAHMGGWNIKDYHTENTRVVDAKVFKIVPGANVGVGMQFPLGSSALFFAEVKYVLAESNQLVFTPGILFVL